jgi:DNA invertase Pin-like site-specific DNA recombinase
MREFIMPTPKRKRKDDPFILPGDPVTALYVRISKKELHAENQIQEFKTKYPEIKVFEIHEEVQKGDKDKPRLNWLLDTLPPKSTIYVYAIDRISRNMVELMNLAKKAIDRKIKIQSMREGDLDFLNPVVLAVVAWVSEMEKKNLSERVVTGIARVKEERNLGPKEWGVGIRKAKAEREGVAYIKPAGRPVRKEFVAAIPMIKKLRKNKLTLKQIAIECTTRFKINFTEPNISNLLKHGHG